MQILAELTARRSRTAQWKGVELKSLLLPALLSPLVHLSQPGYSAAPESMVTSQHNARSRREADSRGYVRCRPMVAVGC